jgi:2-polyprenyl-3-methyl-5-hydroxy-6-metoxy-1,4-benzoquinol methylase
MDATSSTLWLRSKLTRAAFNALYDRFVRPGRFHELNSYYAVSRERYFFTLSYLADLELTRPAKVPDVGGGQFAILASKLFGDDATVADMGDDFRAPADAAGVNFAVCNLLHDDPSSFKRAFDVVALAEVVEHLPMPPNLSELRR